MGRDISADFGHAVKRIMTRNAYDSGRVRSANRTVHKNSSALATICADGTHLPPALIYQGASGDLQDNWTDGSVSPTTTASFSELGVQKEVEKTLHTKGFKEAFAEQAAVLPILPQDPRNRRATSLFLLLQDLEKHWHMYSP